MASTIMMYCTHGCGAYITDNRYQPRANDKHGYCRNAKNQRKNHNYQPIEVSKFWIENKHNSTHKRDGSPYATAVGRFPRNEYNEHNAPNQGQQINENAEHYAPDNNAHQERYALNQKKLREETNEAKHATKAMRNESDKVNQNNEHYAPDNDQNDEDISTVYCGSLNGDRRGRQLPISGRSLRPELDEEKQAKSEENQRNVEISNELNRVKQINAQMRQGNQAMLAELNLVKQSYAHLQHVNQQPYYYYYYYNMGPIPKLPIPTYR
eukprot:1046162_1